MNRLSIRIRLTLIFAVAMAAVISAMGIFLYLRLDSSLTHTLDRSLNSQLNEAVHRSSEPRDLVDRDSSALAQLISADGKVLRSTPPSSRPLLSHGDLEEVDSGHEIVRSGSVQGLSGQWRIRAVPVKSSAGTTRAAVVVASLRPVQNALDHLLTQLLIAGPIAVLLAALGGYVLAASALHPVEAMRRRAEQITAATPGRRLPVPPSGDEIARLGRTLNDMLGRIEAAVEHERRFVADASHELRTPLSLLRTEIELALRRRRSMAELERALRSAAVETDRLSRLAEDLLLIARSDRGSLPIRHERIQVADLLGTVASRFGATAAESGRRIEVLPSNGLVLDADLARLEQALGNLVDNALEHGRGTVQLSAEGGETIVEIHVTDKGGGFPEGFLDRAFERFSRADEARGRGGSGLGLAIVDVVARAHGGTAGARNTPAGADVWLALPVS
jgi:two-component system OmpR family sensor kinase